MEKKLERVISKSEIYDLVCKYMRGLDRLDKDLFRQDKGDLINAYEYIHTKLNRKLNV